MKTFSMFISSLQELRKVKNTTICAMLIALSAVIGMYSVMITPDLRVSFAFLPIALGAYLYGPMVGAILGGTSDIVNFIMKPMGPYFPGFTLSGILLGFIFGLWFYKKNIGVIRIFLANLTVGIIVNAFLNTYWRHMTVGIPFKELFYTRFPWQIVLLVINSIMFFMLYSALKKFISVR